MLENQLASENKFGQVDFRSHLPEWQVEILTKVTPCILGKKQRSAIRKCRCGTAPIRLETGRYEGLPVHDRVCPYCLDVIEDEYHVLCECPLYDD